MGRGEGWQRWREELGGVRGCSKVFQSMYSQMYSMYSSLGCNCRGGGGGRGE